MHRLPGNWQTLALPWNAARGRPELPGPALEGFQKPPAWTNPRREPAVTPVPHQNPAQNAPWQLPRTPKLPIPGQEMPGRPPPEPAKRYRRPALPGKRPSEAARTSPGRRLEGARSQLERLFRTRILPRAATESSEAAQICPGSSPGRRPEAARSQLERLFRTRNLPRRLPRSCREPLSCPDVPRKAPRNRPDGPEQPPRAVQGPPRPI